MRACAHFLNFFYSNYRYLMMYLYLINAQTRNYDFRYFSKSNSIIFSSILRNGFSIVYVRAMFIVNIQYKEGSLDHNFI